MRLPIFLIDLVMRINTATSIRLEFKLKISQK